MLSGLILTAFLMGLTGAPHCASMCGVPCAAALRRAVPVQALIGRWVGYAALGGLAAASSGLVSHWAREVAFLKPFWLIAQAMAVLLGVWLLVSGRLPRQLDQIGLGAYHAFKARWAYATASSSSLWAARVAPFFAGLAWAALPCGLLYGALMVAALAPDALGGALIMTAFALPSGAGVWAASKLLTRMSGGHWQDPTWAIRLSGLMLAVMAGWGLILHVMAQWQAWCG